MADATPPAVDVYKDTPKDSSGRPQTFPNKSSVQSYVYPVRSLLDGLIQPAADQAPISDTSTNIDAQQVRSPSATKQPWSPHSTSNSPSKNNDVDVAARTAIEYFVSEEALSIDRSGTLPAAEDNIEEQEVFSSTVAVPTPNEPLECLSTSDVPFNPSERGLVHLPRVAAPPSPEKEVADKTDVIIPQTFPSPLPEPSTDMPSPHRSQSTSGSGTNSEYFTGNSTLSEELVNFRFEHRQDENGNHLIVGREGVLQKCEDEPICTPGSVQAFGVLIAVQEVDDMLIVRQVSENSTELLGLSPRYLFSLECFTDTLPEAQADLLWDNIQFLGETRNDDDGGPHVFTLSGWGAPGTTDKESPKERLSWRCWCAIHRPTVDQDPLSSTSNLIVMEFEWDKDTINPLYPPVLPAQGTPTSSSHSSSATPGSSDLEAAVNSGLDKTMVPSATPTKCSPSDNGLEGDESWLPSTEDILESTTSYSKPLPALERLRRMNTATAISPTDVCTGSVPEKRSRRRRTATGSSNASVGMMDVFAAMGQINEQLGAVDSLDMFSKVVVGVIKDLTEFHRVMVYQFDEDWNGQVVAELVDWRQTRDLYRGLRFPASDIPAQARALYAINKVRLLYDRSQVTARIVVKSREDLEVPLNMTHCYLRAMSPIHIKYLANMGVRASMSISIMAFGDLWGLITCHSYGPHGMRVSFAVRQMLRLLSQSISRHVERLSYAQRLYTRKLVTTMVSDRRATGYIVSNADDLLKLFDADFGILVIGEGAKILGPNEHGQEILIMAEYLRLKKYNTIQASEAVTKDFPDLQLTGGLHVIAGLLHIPLSDKGTDFIAFLRKGQLRKIRWAGKPFKDGREAGSLLEPRKSFKIWSEVVAGRSRAWTEEQLDTSGVLSLVYGKFIEVWRQRESASQKTKLTELLLSNASHDVRTPLNHIINYLELTLDGPLDSEARENLRRSHTASKSLLFTINDLLDLARLESGKETSFNDPFDLRDTIRKATHLYRKEAERREVKFHLDLETSPSMVIGDATKIRTVVQNLTANSLKCTSKGSITVSCMLYGEPAGLRNPHQVAIEIVVADTGCGIPAEKLENMFREFEQVESLEPKAIGVSGVGLGLAVVARIVKQLGGQLRVESKVDEGSRFSFLFPLSLASAGSIGTSLTRKSSDGSEEFNSLLKSIVNKGSPSSSASQDARKRSLKESPRSPQHTGMGAVDGPLGSMERGELESLANEATSAVQISHSQVPLVQQSLPPPIAENPHLRILVVEDNDINRKILAKRLVLDGHSVVNTTNGQAALDKILSDRDFDAILMDIQMPILNGYDATRKIREAEETSSPICPQRLSYQLNGRIPIFAVSASLRESQYDKLLGIGMDGWILKPIDFRRLGVILKGVTDASQRQNDIYSPEGNWELGGWLR